MNYRQWLFILLISALSLSAFAQYTGPQDNTARTVSAARKALDNTPVILEGYLVRQVLNNAYAFKDDTGKIGVEIKKEIEWPNPISEQDKVTITGRIDRGIPGSEVTITKIERHQVVETQYSTLQ